MSTIRRRTTRRRALMAHGQASSKPGENGKQASPFPAYLNGLDRADTFGKVLSIALKSELAYFQRPLDVLQYRKVSKKVSEILGDLIVPLLEGNREKYSYVNGLLSMDNLKVTYKFLTNMQYFAAAGRFQLKDPFQLEALVPEEQNSVLISLYLRMPPDLDAIPDIGTIPQGSIPFLRVTYRIVKGNRLYTGETREKWKWNLSIPTNTPIVLGLKNGQEGQLTLDFALP